MKRRFIPLLVLLSGFALLMYFDVTRFLNLDALAEHRQWLLDQVATAPWQAAGLYIVAYILVVTFSLPGGLVMTVSGGFLFGAVAGGIYAVIGATIGATLVFLAAKTSLGDWLLQKAGPKMEAMRRGFEQDAFSYLLVLRLIPVFPFFVVNLVPAFLGVSLRVYVLATWLGIMPATFIYALAGAGLGSVLAQGGALSLAGVMTPQVMAALGGLAVLALLPVVYKRLNRQQVVE